MDHKLDRNIHCEPRLGLELVGSHDIFRFAVNMLSQQMEFFQAGRVILVELREMVGPSFDPWAKSVLGEQQYDKLAPYFLRDDHCCACEQELHPDQTRHKLSDAKVACADCHRDGGS